jgi:hypothetical protein
MKKYLVIGHNTKPQLPKDLTPEQQQAWGAFFKTLGDHIVDGGNPLIPTRAVIKDGKVSTVIDTAVGYYMITAESLEEACELTKGSPFADMPGCEVRVYETQQM